MIISNKNYFVDLIVSSQYGNRSCSQTFDASQPVLNFIFSARPTEISPNFHDPISSDFNISEVCRLKLLIAPQVTTTHWTSLNSCVYVVVASEKLYLDKRSALKSAFGLQTDQKWVDDIPGIFCPYTFYTRYFRYTRKKGRYAF